MLGRHRDTDELRRGDRIIAVQAVKDIAEGTKGTVKMSVGQAWTRYQVKWDTGEWMGTVDGDQIVREDRLDLWRRRQAEAEQRAAQAATAAVAAPEASEGGGETSQVPEHLLARSRTARARLEAAKEAS